MQVRELYFIGNYKIDGVENYSDIDTCVEYVKTKKVLGLDIETKRAFKDGQYDERIYKGGLDPYFSKICMLQIGDLDKSFVIDVRDFSNEELKPLIDFIHYNDEVIFVGVNIKFEGKFLKHYYGIRLKRVWDCMICDINLTNGLPLRYSLAHLAERYLGIPPAKEATLFSDYEYSRKVSMDDRRLQENEHLLTPFEIEDNYYIDKSTRLQFIRIGDKPFTKEQVLYGTDDIIIPLLVRERQLLGRELPSGEIYNPKFCHRLENTFTQVLADIELEGKDFDKEYWLELAEKNEQLYQEQKLELEAYVNMHYPQYAGQFNLFTGQLDCMIEWTSPKQVVEFFKFLDICPKEFSKSTKKEEYTVGATALLKTLPNKLKVAYMKNRWQPIEDLDSMVLAFLILKKTEQSITTFGRDWIKYVHPITGKIHSNYRQILNTGRMSSSNPNLQNITGGDFRKAFRVSEGNVMLNNDYSSQESRILADLSGDKSFVDFFLHGDPFFGEDFHSYTATKVFRIKEGNPDLVVEPKDLPDGSKNENFDSGDSEMRDNAKTVNFGFAYGKNERGFSEDFGCTIEEARDFINSYLTAFPGLRVFFDKQKKFAVDNGFIQISRKTDRRWFFNNYDEMNNAKEEALEYYPEDYRTYTKEQKQEFKENLYEEYPHVRDLWRIHMRLKGSLERRGLNYPIQGLASEQLKFSLNALRHDLITNNINDLRIVNVVHDEVLGKCPEQKGEQYGDKLSYYMKLGGDFFCRNKFMKASTVISQVWEH